MENCFDHDRQPTGQDLHYFQKVQQDKSWTLNSRLEVCYCAMQTRADHVIHIHSDPSSLLIMLCLQWCF